jgi:DEAD/DEAH box helicase domain-containing protein
VASVLLLSDPRDLAASVLDDEAATSQKFKPSIVLYDNYPGGIGQSEPLFRRRLELLRMALDLARSCACSAGCPSCVGPHNETGRRGKEGAIAILTRMLNR